MAWSFVVGCVAVAGADLTCSSTPYNLCTPQLSDGRCGWLSSSCEPITALSCPFGVPNTGCTCYRRTNPNPNPEPVFCLDSPCGGGLSNKSCSAKKEEGCRFLSHSVCAYLPEEINNSTLQCPHNLPYLCPNGRMCAGSLMGCTPCSASQYQCWDGQCVSTLDKCDTCSPMAPYECSPTTASPSSCAPTEPLCKCAASGGFLCPGTSRCVANFSDCACPSGTLLCTNPSLPSNGICVAKADGCSGIEFLCPPDAPVFCRTNQQCATTSDGCPCPLDSPIRCPDVSGRRLGTSCARSFSQCPCPANMTNCGQHCSASCTSSRLCEKRCPMSYGCDDGVTPSEPCQCVPSMYLRARFPETMSISASDWNSFVVNAVQKYCDYSSNNTGGSALLLSNVTYKWYVFSRGEGGEIRYVDLDNRSDGPTLNKLQLLPYALEANATYRVVVVARGTSLDCCLPGGRETSTAVSAFITTYLRTPILYFRGEQSRVVTIPRTPPAVPELVSMQLTVDTPCYLGSYTCFGRDPLTRLGDGSAEWAHLKWSCTYGHTTTPQTPCGADIMRQLEGPAYFYNGATLRLITQTSLRAGYTYTIEATYRGSSASQRLLASYYSNGEQGTTAAPGGTSVVTASVSCQVVDQGGSANGQRTVFARDVVACTIAFEVDTYGSGTQVITPDRTPTTIWELACEDPSKSGEAYSGQSLLLVPDGRANGWRDYISLPASRCLQLTIKATTSVAYGGTNFAASDVFKFNRTLVNTSCILTAGGVLDVPITRGDEAETGVTTVSATCQFSNEWPQLDWMAYHQQTSWSTPFETALLPFPTTFPLMTFLAPPPSCRAVVPTASIVVVASYAGRPVFTSEPLVLALAAQNDNTTVRYIGSQMDAMFESKKKWNVTSNGVHQWANSANLMLAAFANINSAPTLAQWGDYIAPTLVNARVLARSYLGGNISYGEDATLAAHRLSSQFILIAQQAQMMIPVSGDGVDELDALVAGLAQESVVPAVIDPNDADSYFVVGLGIATCVRNSTLGASVASSIISAVAKGLAASSAPGAGWEQTFQPDPTACQVPSTKVGNVSIVVKGFVALTTGSTTTPPNQPFPISLQPTASVAWGYQQQLLRSTGNAAVALPDSLLSTGTTTANMNIPDPLSMSLTLILSSPVDNRIPAEVCGSVSVVADIDILTDQGLLSVRNLPSTAPIWLCVPISPEVIFAACTKYGKAPTCPNYRLQYFDRDVNAWSSVGVTTSPEHLVVQTPNGLSSCGFTTHLTTFAVMVGSSTPDKHGDDDDDDDKNEIMSPQKSLIILSTVCVAAAALMLLAAVQFWRRQHENSRKGLLLEEGSEMMMNDSQHVVVLLSSRYPPSPRNRSNSYPGPGYVPALPPLYNPPTKDSLAKGSIDSLATNSFCTSPLVTPNRGDKGSGEVSNTNLTSPVNAVPSSVGTAQAFVATLKSEEDRKDVEQSLQERASREPEMREEDK